MLKEGTTHQVEAAKKPKYLYHASSNQQIEEFEPRQGSYRDSNEGTKVFAAENLGLATAFLVEWDDRWVNLVMHDDQPVLIVSDKKRFEGADKGGTVYVLPSDSFISDPNKGLGRHEWVSSKKVRPVNTIHFPSAIQAMRDNGIRMCYVDQTMFNKLIDSHGEEWNKTFDNILASQ